MTDIVIELEHTNVCMRYACDICNGATGKTDALWVAGDAIICEECCEAGNIDERLEQEAQRLLASIDETVRGIESAAATARGRIGRIKLLTHTERLERKLIGEFGFSQWRCNGSLSALRERWRQQSETCVPSDDCFVFQKFVEMPEEGLITLAVGYYPDWHSKITVRTHGDTFKLPVEWLSHELLTEQLRRDDTTPAERQMLVYEQNRRADPLR
jgi:hypothetical protein